MRLFLIVCLTLLMGFVCNVAVSAESKVSDKASSDKASSDKASSDKENKKREDTITGLSIASMFGDREKVTGPNFNVGFILIPKHLEMSFNVGALAGQNMFIIPWHLSFKVPFYVNSWFAPYIDFGPTYLAKRQNGQKDNNFALSAGLGLELILPQANWGLYAAFDYDFQITYDHYKPEKHINHLGFSIGFNYRM